MAARKIHRDNWTSHFLFTKQLKACISLGGKIRAEGELEEGHEEALLFYIVTLLTKENQEVATFDFLDLSEALQYLNQNYGHWDVQESGHQQGDESSCSTCHAH